MNILLWIYGERNKKALFWTYDDFHSWNEAYAELMKRDAALKLTYADIGICTGDWHIDIMNVYFERQNGRLVPTRTRVNAAGVDDWFERMSKNETT